MRMDSSTGAASGDDTAPSEGRVGGDGVWSEGQELRLSVPSMDCASCASKIETALDGPSIHTLDTRPTSGTVVVQIDPAETTEASVRDAIESAGYEVTETSGIAAQRTLFRTPRAAGIAVGAVALISGLVLEWALPGLNPAVDVSGQWTITGSWIAYMMATGVAGVPIVRAGFASLRARSLDIDFLMGIGVVGAVVINYPFEAATLAVLFSTAELLESYSMDRARNSVRDLMELSPDEATVLRDDEEQTVSAEDVAVGETVVVRPGDRVPVDGIVTTGQSALDESPITGESVPADVRPDDDIYAGSINQRGYLEIEATATAGDSTLATVVDLVEEAGSGDTDAEQFVDRFANVYTPVVVGLAVLTMTLPPLLVGGSVTTWFIRGLTLLVIACPCAFVISTPVSVVSGVTAAARNGVLVKAGEHLEAAGHVDTVAVDKTGTLTTGELAVTDLIPLADAGERDVLSCAAALEQRSEHPIAEAITEHADTREVGTRKTTDFESITGRGVRADVDDETHYAGSPELFRQLGFDLNHTHIRTDGGQLTDTAASTFPAGTDTDLDQLDDEIRRCDHGSFLDLVNQTIPRLQAEGKTVVLVGTADRLEGILAVADTVRPEAGWAVGQLRAAGVERVVMLTGDNRRTAEAIGQEAGIDDVRAGLLPEEKVTAVRELREDHSVLMLGDGINDAPALAAATVGVAMGAAGTDTALETADAALMGDDLSRLPYLVTLSAHARRVIRVNIVGSLAVKTILALGAPLGYVTIAVAVIVGDMGMSLGVTGNAMRLARLSPVDPPTEE